MCYAIVAVPKTDEERRMEDKAQMDFLKRYNNNK